MSTWQQRLFVEREQVRGRATRLDARFRTEAFLKMDEADRKLLMRQHEAMGDYLAVLDERLRLLGPEALKLAAAPIQFAHVLGDAVNMFRRDETLTDERYILVLVGVLHQYVQRLDVRLKAEGAVDKLQEPYDQKLTAVSPSPKAIVDAVVRSIMSVEN